MTSEQLLQSIVHVITSDWGLALWIVFLIVKVVLVLSVIGGGIILLYVLSELLSVKRTGANKPSDEIESPLLRVVGREGR